METVESVFQLVCGQNPDHTWAPGGFALPFCQRCTGLYVGAALAGLLHFLLRPRITARFLEIHGAFVLLMVPFGFHWIEHGGIVRTATGLLFSFGLITFLLLPAITRPVSGERALRPALAYYALLGGIVCLLPLATELGNRFVGQLLSGLGLAGLGLLLGLSLIAICRGAAVVISRSSLSVERRPYSHRNRE